MAEDKFLHLEFLNTDSQSGLDNLVPLLPRIHARGRMVGDGKAREKCPADSSKQVVTKIKCDKTHYWQIIFILYTIRRDLVEAIHIGSSACVDLCQLRKISGFQINNSQTLDLILIAKSKLIQT